LCFHLLGGFQHFVDVAFHVERLLGNVVVLAVDDLWKLRTVSAILT